MSHKRYYAKAGLLWLMNAWRSKRDEFLFDGKSYKYFYHHYNLTWLNERCVEIPIAYDVMKRYSGRRVLEVGNVLSRYNPSFNHTVVDKYEKSRRPNYFTEDAETFSKGAPYDLIISISTLEHVGWDEVPRDQDKLSRTIKHLNGLLSPSGIIFFTAPLGYSDPLDSWIRQYANHASLKMLTRSNAANEWREALYEPAKSTEFHHPYPFANGLVVCEINRYMNSREEIL